MLSASFPDFSGEIDQKIRELSRQATEFKSKDFDKSISCLEQIWTLMAQAEAHHDLSKLIRLPKFLAGAGRFDEAMVYFQRLINETEAHSSRFASSHSSAHFRKCSKHQEYVVIYESILLAFKKAKRDDLIKLCNTEIAKHKKQIEQLLHKYKYAEAKKVLKYMQEEDGVFQYAQWDASGSDHPECAKLKGKVWHKNDHSLPKIVEAHWKELNDKCMCCLINMTLGQVQRAAHKVEPISSNRF